VGLANSRSIGYPFVQAKPKSAVVKRLALSLIKPEKRPDQGAKPGQACSRCKE